MIELHLYWKHDGQDVNLGSGYFSYLPPPGTLLAHPTDHGTVWRVLFAYIHLIQRGSSAYNNWLAGRRTDDETMDVFVEPAEGPFEP